MKTFFSFFIMFALSALSWLLVFSKRARNVFRRRRPWPAELYYESEEEWRERGDTLMKGIVTIPAVFFSLLLIIGAVIFVADLFK
ncbi:MAG: hypothetical protein ACJ74Q_13235 [Pyrinomonadaceae bacterium]